MDFVPWSHVKAACYWSAALFVLVEVQQNETLRKNDKFQSPLKIINDFPSLNAVVTEPEFKV